MRLKGRLIKWDNEKGFGFIQPNGGGEDVFIHKNAFLNRQRQPQINDIITYAITQDKQKRYCAHEAMFTGEKLKPKKAKKINLFSIYLSSTFIAFLFLGFIAGQTPLNLLYLYLGTSVITFITYTIDKAKSKVNAQRIPEKFLHILSLIGGWPGATIAQEFLRHKSSKKEFRIMYWVTVVINLVVFVWLHTESGGQYLHLIA